ncbi:MAG: hypothetical protein RIC81_01890 [Microcella pacifica]|jgi:hypothetical protein|uniref:Uncharacterized protein n=1 Tax=Microcella pacifica TaxID=2591847 RepID=A0A9E5JNV0_9MICO|nr:hypothetical protein [Microcella pacifica]NHF64154.1 hypothetical protein [Microcella pacifica]
MGKSDDHADLDDFTGDNNPSQAEGDDPAGKDEHTVIPAEGKPSPAEGGGDDAR